MCIRDSPKSVTKSRIESNFQQISLTDEQFDRISSLCKKLGGPIRFFTPYGNFQPLWDMNVFNEPAEQAATHQIRVV